MGKEQTDIWIIRSLDQLQNNRELKEAIVKCIEELVDLGGRNNPRERVSWTLNTAAVESDRNDQHEEKESKIGEGKEDLKEKSKEEVDESELDQEENETKEDKKDKEDVEAEIGDEQEDVDHGEEQIEDSEQKDNQDDKRKRSESIALTTKTTGNRITSSFTFKILIEDFESEMYQVKVTASCQVSGRFNKTAKCHYYLAKIYNSLRANKWDVRYAPKFSSGQKFYDYLGLTWTNQRIESLLRDMESLPVYVQVSNLNSFDIRGKPKQDTLIRWLRWSLHGDFDLGAVHVQIRVGNFIFSYDNPTKKHHKETWELYTRNNNLKFHQINKRLCTFDDDKKTYIEYDFQKAVSIHQLKVTIKAISEQKSTYSLISSHCQTNAHLLFLCLFPDCEKDYYQALRYLLSNIDLIVHKK